MSVFSTPQVHAVLKMCGLANEFVRDTSPS